MPEKYNIASIKKKKKKNLQNQCDPLLLFATVQYQLLKTF